MVKKAAVALLAAATGVGIATAVTISQAAPNTQRSLTISVLPSNLAVNGIVNSRPQPQGIIGVLVSLHHLEANTSYEITGNRKPCSVVDALDYAAWSVSGATKSSDDIFASAKVDREQPGNVRSTRINRLGPEGSRAEVACAPATAYVKFDGVDGE